MTIKDKSTLWQHLGIIEGIGLALDEKFQGTFFDSLVVIQEILEKECDTE